MKGDDFIVSGFDGEAGETALFAVDFASAKQLDAGGSTCDVYECIVQRRRVFVKRLKAEYRDNPLYRSAFNKEYDLGVSLSHPSLPRYVGFGCDYIVMDYIEGDTLADLIKRADRRLKDKRFARKLLCELTDVVEYLHHRNIIHCDIKPDNIIVSPYADRPVTLIDFDKAYSPWLDSTNGNPAKYGCDGCADGIIDYKGLGLIAERLGMKRFAEACGKEDASAENLRKALKNRRIHVAKAIIWSASISLIVISVIMVVGNKIHDNTVAISEPTPEPPVLTTPGESLVESPAESPTANFPDVPDFEVIVKRHYGPLAKRHDYLRALAADSMTSARQLRMALTAYADDQLKAQSKIFSDAMEQYGFSNSLDVHPMLGVSREWSAFMKADAELNRLYSREIDAREVKESQRSPTHPVSQPDTLPSDSLHVPHH